MQRPLQVVFHDFERSDAIEDSIRRHAEDLERYFDRITACRVVVEAPHRRHHRGRVYSVRIELDVPRRTIVVDRPQHLDHAHEDVYVAVGDAFRAVRRQLEDHVRKMRGDVKQHEGLPHGRVVRVFPDEGYGFLETADGTQVYFHENSLLQGALDQIQIGTEVRFSPGVGDQGPTAASVSPVGRHGHAT